MINTQQREQQVDDAWTRIERWLQGNAPALATEVPGPASEAAIAACEAKLGVAMPADLRRSLARHGAPGRHGYADLIGNWVLLDLDVIVREHQLMERLRVAGDLDGDADPHPRITRTWWSPTWIPVVSSGSGHQICVDTAPPPGGVAGQVIVFFHDSGKRLCIADSFASWLTAIAGGLEASGLGWRGPEEGFADEAFLSIALEGQDTYAPKAPKAKAKAKAKAPKPRKPAAKAKATTTKAKTPRTKAKATTTKATARKR